MILLKIGMFCDGLGIVKSWVEGFAYIERLGLRAKFSREF